MFQSFNKKERKMADTACIQRETPNLAKSMKRVSCELFSFVDTVFVSMRYEQVCIFNWNCMSYFECLVQIRIVQKILNKYYMRYVIVGHCGLSLAQIESSFNVVVIYLFFHCYCFFIAVQQAIDGEKEKRTNKLISGTTQTTRPGINEKRCKYLKLCIFLKLFK